MTTQQLSSHGVSLYKKGDFVAAIRVFDEFLGQSTGAAASQEESEKLRNTNASEQENHDPPAEAAAAALTLSVDERCAGLCNRAAAHLALGKWANALNDARECLTHDPRRWKAVKREADALVGMGRLREASDVLRVAETTRAAETTQSVDVVQLGRETGDGGVSLDASVQDHVMFMVQIQDKPRARRDHDCHFPAYDDPNPLPASGVRSDW